VGLGTGHGEAADAEDGADTAAMSAPVMVTSTTTLKNVVVDETTAVEIDTMIDVMIDMMIDAEGATDH
jgi:hypothetical protein